VNAVRLREVDMGDGFPYLAATNLWKYGAYRRLSRRTPI
jgi:hypothetical protein